MSSRPRRLLAVLFVALSALTAGCGALGEEPEAAAAGGSPILRIGLPTGVTSFANADVLVAKEKGFLADYGVAAEIQNFRSGVSVVQAVAEGQIDIGASSIEPVVNAAAGGTDIVIIGAPSDRLAVSAVTPKDILTPADLRGRPLGVQEVGAFREVMTRLVLQQGGLTPNDVQYVPVDAQAYTAALVDGRIQSAILQTEQAVAAAHAYGNLHVLANLADIVPNYHYGTFFVSRTWLEANRDKAERLLTAITKTHRYMYSNKDETVRIVADATGFDDSIISEAYDILLKERQIFPLNTGLDPERIRSTVDTMRQLGILDGEAPPIDRLVDTGPATNAIKQLGELSGVRR
ncbi:ABC-type nitrate/sulfonate/bicarbonate transport system substrate-binding protein [Pseudonocardia hierapolitana]|uniref:ABC-type nitrate/sulfonate/bicarbonate transport system substrate-binding protein n=1 Tax=Pseudonocardia hierapolitana TaxID=1128676 RepID=A0A561SRE6_9PSEU|nr:ABC transporter substrate-binding protein [Pseudonocardia hierapolitana]TWF77439.1 ABC-type nitrate/sulfonate/bicarbonate transport system substrate-binding protein [Pseudonocardia hierapolitana]